MSAVIDSKVENPYVAVIARKHRNLKKKLEKIAKAESQLSLGKVIDEEQQILLASKKAIEKSVTDLLQLRQQLEEVAKLEEDAVRQKELEQATSAASAFGSTANASNFESSEERKGSPEAEGITVGTFTDFALEIQQLAASTMTEPEETPAAPIDLRAEVQPMLVKLMTALNVLQRYESVTGKKMDAKFQYFAQTLLGLTSLSTFQSALDTSVKFADLFLHDGNAELVRGMTFGQVSTLIDSMAEDMRHHTGNGNLDALIRSTSTPAAAPIPAPVVETELIIKTPAVPPAPKVTTTAASAPPPAVAYDPYGSRGHHDFTSSGLQFSDNHGLGTFGMNAPQYGYHQAPVYSAPEPQPVYQQPVHVAPPAVVPAVYPSLPVVSIAPALTEPEIVPATTTAAEPTPVSEKQQQEGGNLPKRSRNNRPRNRNDRNRDPNNGLESSGTTTHAVAPAPETEGTKSFKDRLVSGKKERAQAAPQDVQPAATQVQAPIPSLEPTVATESSVASAAPVTESMNEGKGKKSYRERGARKEKPVVESVPADTQVPVSAAVASADDAAAKPRREKKRPPKGNAKPETTEVAQEIVEAPKKSSYLEAASVVGGSSTTSAPAASTTVPTNVTVTSTTTTATVPQQAGGEVKERRDRDRRRNRKENSTEGGVAKESTTADALINPQAVVASAASTAAYTADVTAVAPQQSSKPNPSNNYNNRREGTENRPPRRDRENFKPREDRPPRKNNDFPARVPASAAAPAPVVPEFDDGGAEFTTVTRKFTPAAEKKHEYYKPRPQQDFKNGSPRGDYRPAGPSGERRGLPPSAAGGNQQARSAPRPPPPTAASK
jgi:hypothetical protein